MDNFLHTDPTYTSKKAKALAQPKWEKTIYPVV